MAVTSSRGRLVGLLAGTLVVAGLLVWWVGRKAEEPTSAKKAERSATVSRFAADPGDEPAAATSTIQGTVVDQSGKPAADALVSVARTRGREQAWSADFGRALEVAKTGADGRFAFTKLAPGSYAVSAMAQGHGPTSQGPIEVAASATQQIELRPVGSWTPKVMPPWPTSRCALSP
jgi:Carboxypeptidase regulatory-like domain